MDVRRHVTAGRLSELFGEDAARDRRVHPHPGLAPGRRAGAGAARARDPRRARGVRRRRQRLPRRARRVASWRSSTPCSRAGGLDYRARAVDRRRLAGLAQGDGLGPARQHDRRDRPGAGAGRRTAPSEVAELYPPYPYDEQRADRRPGRGRRRRLRAGRHRARHPAARSGRRTSPADAQAACAGCATASARLPALLGRGDGIGSNGWVVDGEHSATGAAAARQRPAPRRHPARASGCRWGCTAATVSRRLPARRRRLHLLRRARRDHRPQRRHRLGVHQPRRPTSATSTSSGSSATGGSYDGAAAPAAAPATETIEVRGGDDVELTSARPRTGRCCPTSPTTSRRSASSGARDRHPAARRTDYAVSLAWTALEPPPTADAILALNLAARLGLLPGGRRRSSRARRRTSSTPTARATSATRRRAGSRSGSPATTATCRPRAGAPTTTGPATTCRSTALPSVLDPEEGFVVTANQAVIGRRATPTPHRRLGPRLPRAADPRPARGRRASSRSTRWPSSSSTTATRWRRCWCRYLLEHATCRAATTPTASELLADWDFSPVRRQRGRGVLQRRVAQPARADLPRRPARGRLARRRAAVDARWSRRCSSDPATRGGTTATTEDEVETRDDILRQAHAATPATS